MKPLSTILIILTLTFASAVIAEPATTFRPALIGTGESSVVALTHCPTKEEGDPDLVMVMCQGEVARTGELKQPWCFVYDNTPRYLQAARQALGDARLEPATIDGNPVSVYMSFRIAFQRQGDQCNVIAIPNKGFLAGEFGIAYVEPQQITDRKWHNRRLNTGAGRNRRGGIAYTLSCDVDASGNPSNAAVEKNNFGGRRDVSRALKAAGDARFIPGFAEGKVQEMKSYEFYYVEANMLDTDITEAPADAPAGGRGTP